MARSGLTFSDAANAAPPHAWFAISAVFHYLGPSFAVLLFPSVGVLGVAWMRIAAAAAIFAPWTAPWRTMAKADGQTRRLLIGLGVCLAVMNTAFYLALDRFRSRGSRRATHGGGAPAPVLVEQPLPIAAE